MAAVGGSPPLIPGGLGGAYMLGQELLNRYNSAPIGYRARLVIGHTNDDDYIVTDPDRNEWDESLLVGGHDTLALWVRPAIFLSPMGTPMMASIFTISVCRGLRPGRLHSRCPLWSLPAKLQPTGIVPLWLLLSWRL